MTPIEVQQQLESLTQHDTALRDDMQEAFALLEKQHPNPSLIAIRKVLETILQDLYRRQGLVPGSQPQERLLQDLVKEGKDGKEGIFPKKFEGHAIMIRKMANQAAHPSNSRYDARDVRLTLETCLLPIVDWYKQETGAPSQPQEKTSSPSTKATTQFTEMKLPGATKPSLLWNQSTRQPQIPSTLTSGDGWPPAKKSFHLTLEWALSGVLVLIFVGLTGYVYLLPKSLATQPVSDKPTVQLPIDYAALLTSGEAKLRNGNYDDAITDFNKVIASDPNNEQAYFELGVANDAKNDEDDALTALSKAVSMNPNDAAAFAKRAIVKNETHDDSGALSDLNQSIALDPNNAQVLYNRACIEEQLQDQTGAVEDFTKVTVLNPNSDQAFYALGLLKFRLNDDDGAIAALDKDLTLDPGDAKGFAYRGLAKADKNNFKDAITDLDSAIKLDPTMADSYYYRGKYKLAADDVDGAITDFEKVIELHPDDLNSYASLGTAKMQKKDYEGAIAEFDAAIKIDPTVAQIFEYRSQAKRAKGDTAGADSDHAEALSLANK